MKLWQKEVLQKIDKAIVELENAAILCPYDSATQNIMEYFLFDLRCNRTRMEVRFGAPSLLEPAKEILSRTG